MGSESIPKCIVASHAVPYGRTYRQWNTCGELLLWANRGEVVDLRYQGRSARGDSCLVSELMALGPIGIPVVEG
jgi:hypothetical protein